jgi:phage terminase large subunit-like protein
MIQSTRPAAISLSRERAESLLAQVREERRRRTEERCRDSLHDFFVAGFSVLESTTLEPTPWIRAQCDTVQAWLEGWLVAAGRDKDGHPLKASTAMVSRQAAHWRRELAGEPGAEELLATEPWFEQPLVQDLVINGYPGSLKSRIAMVYALAWVWLWDPTFTMAATSGTSDNVARDSNLCKELVRAPWYRETFRIAWGVGVNRGGSVVDSQELWAVSKGGYRLSKELFSSWQGVHVDLLAIDDPDDAAKVWGEADRKKARKKITALRNRVAHPLKSLRLIVQQRVHPEDVTWHAKSVGTWSPQHRKRPALLSIPLQFRAALAVRTPWGWNDPRTVEDEVSHPERYTEDFIDAERIAYTSTGFESQYNQNPEAETGGWFPRVHWGFWRAAGQHDLGTPRPHGCLERSARPAVEIEVNARGQLVLDYTDMVLDATFGSKESTASAVSISIWGGRGGYRLLLLDSTEPRSYTETENEIRRIVRTWTMTRIGKLLVEEAAQGTAIMDRLQKAMSGIDPDIPPLIGPDGKAIVIPIEPVSAQGGKEPRARAAMPTQEAGLVLLPEGAACVPAWVDEVSPFPFAKRNDRVDCFTHEVAFRSGHSVAKATTRREIDAMLKFAGR